MSARPRHHRSDDGEREKRSLAAILRDGGPFAVTEAVDVALDICDVLSSAHANGVVHGDLGLHRVRTFWPREAGEPVEIFAHEDDDTAALNLRSSMGAILASPEQRAGFPVDQRTDVYAVGAILHWLITGAPPYSEQLPRSLDGLPRPITNAIFSCLATDPARRPQSVDEIAEALGSFSEFPSARFEQLARRRNGLRSELHYAADRNNVDLVLHRLDDWAMKREVSDAHEPPPGAPSEAFGRGVITLQRSLGASLAREYDEYIAERVAREGVDVPLEELEFEDTALAGPMSDEHPTRDAFVYAPGSDSITPPTRERRESQRLPRPPMPSRSVYVAEPAPLPGLPDTSASDQVTRSNFADYSAHSHYPPPLPSTDFAAYASAVGRPLPADRRPAPAPSTGLSSHSAFASGAPYAPPPSYGEPSANGPAHFDLYRPVPTFDPLDRRLSPHEDPRRRRTADVRPRRGTDPQRGAQAPAAPRLPTPHPPPPRTAVDGRGRDPVTPTEDWVDAGHEHPQKSPSIAPIVVPSSRARVSSSPPPNETRDRRIVAHAKPRPRGRKRTALFLFAVAASMGALVFFLGVRLRANDNDVARAFGLPPRIGQGLGLASQPAPEPAPLPAVLPAVASAPPAADAAAESEPAPVVVTPAPALPAAPSARASASTSSVSPTNLPDARPPRRAASPRPAPRASESARHSEPPKAAASSSSDVPSSRESESVPKDYKLTPSSLTDAL